MSLEFNNRQKGQYLQFLINSFQARLTETVKCLPPSPDPVPINLSDMQQRHLINY